MIVRMKTDCLLHGQNMRDGEKYDIADHEARALIRTGQAAGIETMPMAAPENAARNFKKLSRR